MNRTLEPILYSDSARGVYIPQHFIETFNLNDLRGVGLDEILELRKGPEADQYWDAWDMVLQNAYTVSDTGVRYTLHHDGDLWMIPSGMAWSDEEEWFYWPECSSS
jgi:hypothetical protein